MKAKTLMRLKHETTPAEFAHTLREMGDIFWWEPGNFYVVTSMDLAREALGSADYTCDRAPFFISRMPELDLSLVTDFFRVVSEMMVMQDGQAHASRRRICYHGFTSHVLDKLQPLIEHTVATCLEGFSDVSFEFVSQLAQVLPSTTLAEFFSIPHSERQDFYTWSNAMTQFFGGSTSYQNADGIAVNASAKHLYAYFEDRVQQCRKRPGEDFLSTLLKHQAHFGLSDAQIISQAVMMLVAGQVTTTDQLCNTLHGILSVPGLWQMLVRKPEWLDAAIEEGNRLDPGVTFIFRLTARDTMLGGEVIPKGKVIFISAHAINRDPAWFPEPDVLLPSGRKVPHLAYGHGAHFCLGAKLARREMRAALLHMLQRFPELRIDDGMPSVRKHHSLSFSGFEQLWLRQ